MLPSGMELVLRCSRHAIGNSTQGISGFNILVMILDLQGRWDEGGVSEGEETQRNNNVSLW